MYELNEDMNSMNQNLFIRTPQFDQFDYSFTKSYLKIVDICDYLILAISHFHPSWKCSTLDRAIQLYKEMDIQPEITETNFNVSKETIDFIASVCGLQISNCHKMKVDKLIIDISKIIEFQELQKSWSFLNKIKTIHPPNNPLPILIEYKRNNEDIPVDMGGILALKGGKEPQGYESQSSILGALDKVHQPLNGDITEVVYIIYHSLYNIALVIKEQKEFLQYMCEDFSEFKIITCFPLEMHGKNICEQAKPFFHKQFFESNEELQKKVDAFKSLYNLNIPSNNNLREEINEREEVHMLIKKMYNITNDPKDRIKAVTLYKKIENLLPISNRNNTTNIHKHFAIYFMELGLTRKRFTDGVYYYGLQLKQKDPFTSSIEGLSKTI